MHSTSPTLPSAVWFHVFSLLVNCYQALVGGCSLFYMAVSTIPTVCVACVGYVLCTTTVTKLARVFKCLGDPTPITSHGIVLYHWTGIYRRKDNNNLSRTKCLITLTCLKERKRVHKIRVMTLYHFNHIQRWCACFEINRVLLVCMILYCKG